MMQKVSVLQIIGKRPVGGIGAFVYNYQLHFTDEDLQVDYLLFDDEPVGPFDRKVRKLGSEVYVLPALKNTRLFSIWRDIAEFMGSTGKKYQIIHLHSVNIAFMCFPCAKRAGVRHLIAHSHATVYSEKRLNAIRNQILCRNLKKQATDFVACSVEAGKFLFGEGDIDRVEIFNNAIECENFRFSEIQREKVRKELGWDNRIVIGNVGRFCRQKNQEGLLDMFAACVSQEPRALLVLVGDGPLMESAVEKAESLGVSDSVSFLGYRSDVDSLLQGMDVFALPSLYEGLPVIGVEAQAAGLPIVASDSITKELDLTGVTFLPLSAGSETWGLELLEASRSRDARSRRKMCDVVKKKGFDIEEQAKRLQEFYRRIVARN